MGMALAVRLAGVCEVVAVVALDLEQRSPTNPSAMRRNAALGDVPVRSGNICAFDVVAAAGNP
jgi:hypothetical protein